MNKKIEMSLIIRKETNFDKIRETLFKIFIYKDNEMKMIKRLNTLLYRTNKPKGNIIIPKEIRLTRKLT